MAFPEGGGGELSPEMAAMIQHVGSFKNTGYPLSDGQRKRRRKAIHKLQSKIASLEADARRLDWLESRHIVRWGFGRFTAQKTNGWFLLGPQDVPANSLREAIDAAKNLAPSLTEKPVVASRGNTGVDQ